MTNVPMSPGQHYLAAEADIAEAYVAPSDQAAFLLARAQVHATLATVDWQMNYGDAIVHANRRRRLEAEVAAAEEGAEEGADE